VKPHDNEVLYHSQLTRFQFLTARFVFPLCQMFSW